MSSLSMSIRTRFSVSPFAPVPVQAAHADCVLAELAAVGVEGCAHAVRRGVEFVDRLDAEARAEGLPYVGPHAVPHAIVILCCLSAVRAGR